MRVGAQGLAPRGVVGRRGHRGARARRERNALRHRQFEDAKRERGVAPHGVGVVQRTGAQTELGKIGVEFSIRPVDSSQYERRVTSRDFDMVYSVSIFSHLSVPDQEALIVELARVTRPGDGLSPTTEQ